MDVLLWIEHAHVHLAPLEPPVIESSGEAAPNEAAPGTASAPVLESALACPLADLASLISEAPWSSARFVLEDVRTSYVPLIGAGVRLRRALDLRLCRAIVDHTPLASEEPEASSGDHPGILSGGAAQADHDAQLSFSLFDDATPEFDTAALHSSYLHVMQRLRRVPAPERLALLLEAESVGALIATELSATGLPWSTATHLRYLERELGPKPVHGGRPAKLEAIVQEIREILGDSKLNPESAASLLKALRKAGLQVQSTSKWELRRVEHPVIAPLQEFKRLHRLMTANGWTWMQQWVRGDRLHTDYVPAGVVTGRWATRGGGGMQLPRSLRSAAVADPGWKFVIADAAQLEPRVLAGMSRDLALAAAGRGSDLYQGLVDAGAVPTRQDAKFAMLGALYGATSGAAGRLLPRLRSNFPLAIGMVDAAALAGERGEYVETWLGRRSPDPSARWLALQSAASADDANPAAVRAASAAARERGRFTRNFVVQGSAAEWSAFWMAGIRKRLSALDDSAGSAELVFFLHDEIIVHAPEHLAEACLAIVHEAAAAAGRALFGSFPIEFRLSASIANDYGAGKALTASPEERIDAAIDEEGEILES
ncbi:bifunctional 3'-5' exonuclease/DNA polymerase [Humidisolicoccus flavus]|uniref:bifunctional 3'-5' exonuclease/DNA polymerase n=1 Tax=Humidisolicoccus flavus TaxID=3111414 RepID=UPI0032530BA0